VNVVRACGESSIRGTWTRTGSGACAVSWSAGTRIECSWNRCWGEPAKLTRLERAVRRAHAAYEKAETAAREQQHADHKRVEDDEPIGGELDDTLDDAA